MFGMTFACILIQMNNQLSEHLQTNFLTNW